MFQYLTRSLRRLKYGRHLQALLVIVALYAFALLAGLSPSVVRAATMFSLFVFAQSLRRETNSMNTLFISFLALLILNPLWLFHVGFQMSYLAVFFILWVQPIFYKLWKPKAWLPKKAWGIASVTLAAQLGVIPVSLYYFHQLPGLFLLTNLVVLPFIGVLLVAGLIILILALLQSLPDFLAITYNYLVTGLNAFIGWVASQDAFLFSEIPFNVWNVLAAYAIIVGVILFWQRRTLATLGFTLAGVLILLSGLVYNKLENSREALVIFHKSRTSLMAVRENGTLRLFHRDTVPKAWESTYPVAAYLLETGNPEVQQEPLPDVFQYKEKTIVVVDSAGIYPTSRTVDIVLLTQSPRVNLDRLIATLNPSLIIADGNNYRSYVTRWRETCQKKKLPFHHTGTKGAFIIEQ
jgi:competence protein ComEC